MMMRVISLGWGVQSFALAAMSALGILPPVDAAIHADTTHERKETYDLAREMTPWLERRGVKVVTVKPAANKLTKFVDAFGGVYLPGYTRWVADGYHTTKLPDGSPIKVWHNAGEESGQLRRQCTGDWKIAPIKRWLQAHRNGQQVKQQLGITMDEVARMKNSGVKYIKNVYPFIDTFDQPMTRTAVKQWLHEQGLPIPVKSSCVFCPYHDRATWREIKLAGNGDWEKAVAVDEAIRDKRPGYLCYLTATRIPLEEVDFSNEQDHGQLTLWDEECSGMCFL